MIRVPPVSELDEAMAEHLATTSYEGPYPDGTEFDEHGLPIVEPHPDEDPDELI